MVRVKANSRHIYRDHVHNMRHAFRVFIVNLTELTGILLFRYLGDIGFPDEIFGSVDRITNASLQNLIYTRTCQSKDS